MRNGPRVNPYRDPTIGRASGQEFGRLWTAVEHEVANGVPYHVARERILAHNVPFIRKRYGNAVADRVVKTFEHCGPEAVSKAAAYSARLVIEREFERTFAREGKSMSWINRWFFRRTGVLLYWPWRRRIT
jgi:hypothetical protein